MHIEHQSANSGDAQHTHHLKTVCIGVCMTAEMRNSRHDSWARGNSGVYRLQSSGHPFQYFHLPLFFKSFSDQHAKALQNSSTNEAIYVTPAVLQV